MDTHEKLEIAEWQDGPSPVVPKANGPQLWSPTLIGILGTLLLHSFVLQSVQLASRGIKVARSDSQDASGDPDRPRAEAGENLVLIALPSIPESQFDAIQNIVSSLPELVKIRLDSSAFPDAPEPLNIDSLTLGEEQASNVAPESAGDGSDRARLMGIYTGQIQARIDRVWRRPRTPVSEEPEENHELIADESFQCEAQIVQSADGYVQEILLPRCNGSPAWQHSLVTAIRQASPLPAPPDPAVFSRSITLSFVGIPYVRGAADEEYEMSLRSAARTD